MQRRNFTALVSLSLVLTSLSEASPLRQASKDDGEMVRPLVDLLEQMSDPILISFVESCRKR